MEFIREGNALLARRGGETVRIEPWGKDSLRVRAWMYGNADAPDILFPPWVVMTLS